MKEKKLYRIGNSKESTLEILKRMTHNLQVARQAYANIEVRIWKHNKKPHEIDYWFGVGKGSFDSLPIKTWSEVLAVYRKLMKEAKDG